MINNKRYTPNLTSSLITFKTFSAAVESNKILIYNNIIQIHLVSHEIYNDNNNYIS